MAANAYFDSLSKFQGKSTLIMIGRFKLTATSATLTASRNEAKWNIAALLTTHMIAVIIHPVGLEGVSGIFV